MTWIRNSVGILPGVALALLLAALPATGAELSDAEVKRAIETQMAIDGAIPYTQMEVTVSQGIAELTGTVDNILAKERSTYVAEHVKGVRAVSNRIAVKPGLSRSDADIETAIRWALAMDPAADSYEIDVAVKDRVAELTGTVHSYAEKQLAGRVAKGVSGVVSVENKLGIDYTEERTDAEILNDIVQRLRWDVLVSDGLIDVAVNDGYVKLSGTSGSAAEKRQAQWDAWVFGVKAVDASQVKIDPLVKDDDLRANKYAPKSDDAIREAVRDAALFDPRVYSFNLNPAVDGGWVTLTGSVDSASAKRAAGQLARNTVGVRGVTNLLDVRPAVPKTDAAIAADVRGALMANRYTDSFQINLTVDDGVVTLRGNVETPFERAEAGRVASNVNGTREVVNEISAIGTFGNFGTSYYFSTWYPPAVSIQVQEKTDSTLLEDVNEELFWSPFVDSDQVGVEVQNGIVTLSGSVDSWREYRAAEENAFEAGASSVINNIQVDSQS